MATSDSLILYVDDERSNRIVFEQSFGRRFTVKTASSGSEALEFLKTNTVAVLVTDQRMPGMSGNELLTRVKELYPDIIRIAITAYSDLDPILSAVNDGLVVRYIIKPWDATELEQVLAWSLEAFQLGRENSALQLRLIQTERLVTLGSIAATVIHDLNQPLSYLLTNTERLSQLAPGAAALGEVLARHGHELPSEARQQLLNLTTEIGDIVRDMLEGCRLMHGLTSSMRRLTKPASPLEPANTDPLPVIRYAISVCRNIAIGARGTILYDGPTTLPRLAINSIELSQALINVVANAAQALTRRSAPGGRVTVSVADDDGLYRIIVADDGPGMTSDVLERVGTLFFSTRPEGTGLGVAQCRRLIERRNGSLEIQSTVDVGTTVTIKLPKA